MEAGKAHHQAFIEQNGKDPDWPIWYANYLQTPLSEILNADLTQSQIVYLLVMLDAKQSLEAPAGNWRRYYAQQLAQRYL